MPPETQFELSKKFEKRIEDLEKKMEGLIGRNRQSGDSLHAEYKRSDAELSLYDLWTILWRGKWLVFGITVSFAIIFVLYSLSLTNVYKSEALLAPAEENSGGGLATLAGQFGGLASLAGVNLNGEGAGKTDLAIEVLKSRGFIGHFIQKYELNVPLMAAKGWNQETGELIFDPQVYDSHSKVWTRQLSPPKGAEPSLQEAYEAFKKRMSVSRDNKTNLILLSVEFYSPVIAKQWVDLLVSEINSAIRMRDVKEAENSIEYLKKQIEKTSVADMQSVFYELIEKQTKVVMFAEVRDEYVFKTIDAAIIPERKEKPNRLLICISGIFAGGLLSVIFVFLQYLYRSMKFNRKI